MVFAIEALGNPRLRDEIGELALVPDEQRISGPGTSPIKAAFIHLNPEGSHFSDASYGVYYAAADLATAVAEVSHHHTRFLARTQEPTIDIDLCCYQVSVIAVLCDLRSLRGEFSAESLHHPDSYVASQLFGDQLRLASEPEASIAYDSVRWPGGQCVALFTPHATRSVKSNMSACAGTAIASASDI